MGSSQTFVKGDGSTLDFGIDWRADGWLEDGENISSSSWSTPTPTTTPPLTVDSDEYDVDQTKVWLSGGKAGVQYEITNTIVTDNSPARTDERTLTIYVKEDR